ncbi:hypothetical protein ACH4SP_14275 [Streptomyces sp. NPDC021093]|uniref:hypothetical protein n=1 Tax=Streptomyces sp. NPDC021093 TaxID=3365112 RepID=UPI00379691EC
MPTSLTSLIPGKRSLAAAAVLVSLSLLTGCGGGGGGGDGAKGTEGRSDVASLDKGDKGDEGKGADRDASEKAKSPEEAKRDAAESGRPQRRLDTSDEEEQRMWNTYNSCLKDNGVKMQQGMVVGSGETPVEGPREPKAAYEKCLIKLPLMPPEMDPKTNPRYQDDFTEWVRCINEGGVGVKALADGSGWTYTGDLKMPGAQAHKIENDCKVKAFRDKG